MGGQPGNDILPVKSFAQYFIQDQDRRTYISCQDCIRKTEIIFVIEYIQIVDDSLISNIAIGKTNYLVENRQGITHTAISFLGNYVQSFRLSSHIFLRGNIFQMFHHIGNRDAGEIIYLTTRQNSRKYFMLLGCR